MTSTAILDDRGIVAITGDDRVDFLQGLVSNDVSLVGPSRSVHAALLTPQGKYLHDFTISSAGDALYLDVEAARADDLVRRLRMYRLRSKVELQDLSSTMEVSVAWGADAAAAFGLPDERGAARYDGAAVVMSDPRHAGLGVRIVAPKGRAAEIAEASGARASPRGQWDRLRISLGVPEGSRDLAIEKSTLMESGFDELGGISWTKGCYMGQELTARTKYRGLVKRRLVPVEIEGPPPAPGTPITLDGADAGEMREAVGDIGLAVVRLDALADGRPLRAGDARLTPRKPDWARF